MGVALLRYGYEQLGLETITASAMPGNAASLHVLEKCGLERKGNRRFAHPMYAPLGEVAYFERGAKEWLADMETA
jgi:RimJ/RimL family protein N-acetyltransferase